MAIRRLYGTGTADAGVFWSDCVNSNEWRIQYNLKTEATYILKPYRLIDPNPHGLTKSYNRYSRF
jgi:hypothetical protein